MDVDLETLAEESDHSVRAEKYRAFLARSLEAEDVDACLKFVNYVLQDSTSLLLSRSLLSLLVLGFSRLSLESEAHLAAATLSALSIRAVSYEAVAAALQERLSATHAARGDWRRAAQALRAVDTEGQGLRALSPEARLSLQTRAAAAWLRAGEAAEAEAALRKASALLPGVEPRGAPARRYHAASAQVLQARQRFAEAAARFHELSFGEGDADEEPDKEPYLLLPLLQSAAEEGADGGRVPMEVASVAGAPAPSPPPPSRARWTDPLPGAAQALNAAAVCAVLSEAGARRQRLLAQLCADERGRGLPARGMLERVFRGRLLSRGDAERFAEGLDPAQRAALGGEESVRAALERAAAEHNLEAASKLFASVSLEALGALLGAGAEAAEAAAARMACEGRLDAVIDQGRGMLFFDAVGQEQRAHASQSDWDARVHRLCDDVATLAREIKTGRGGRKQ